MVQNFKLHQRFPFFLNGNMETIEKEFLGTLCERMQLLNDFFKDYIEGLAIKEAPNSIKVLNVFFLNVAVFFVETRGSEGNDSFRWVTG